MKEVSRPVSMQILAIASFRVVPGNVLRLQHIPMGSDRGLLSFPAPQGGPQALEERETTFGVIVLQLHGGTTQIISLNIFHGNNK